MKINTKLAKNLCEAFHACGLREADYKTANVARLYGFIGRELLNVRDGDFGVAWGVPGGVPRVEVGGDDWKIKIMGVPKHISVDITRTDCSGEPKDHSEHFTSLCLSKGEYKDEVDFLNFDGERSLRVVKLDRWEKEITTWEEEENICRVGVKKTHIPKMIAKRQEEWKNCVLKTPRGERSIMHRVWQAKVPCEISQMFYHHVADSVEWLLRAPFDNSKNTSFETAEMWQ